MSNKDIQMYTVEVIKDNGELGNMFTLDLDGLNKLLELSTPLKASFKIQKI